MKFNYSERLILPFLQLPRLLLCSVSSSTAPSSLPSLYSGPQEEEEIPLLAWPTAAIVVALKLDWNSPHYLYQFARLQVEKTPKRQNTSKTFFFLLRNKWEIIRKSSHSGVTCGRFHIGKLTRKPTRISNFFSVLWKPTEKSHLKVEFAVCRIFPNSTMSESNSNVSENHHKRLSSKRYDLFRAIDFMCFFWRS